MKPTAGRETDMVVSQALVSRALCVMRGLLILQLNRWNQSNKLEIFDQIWAVPREYSNKNLGASRKGFFLG